MSSKETEEAIVNLLEEQGEELRADTLVSKLDESEEDIKRAIPKLVDEGELAITTNWKYRVREDHEPNYKL